MMIYSAIVILLTTAYVFIFLVYLFGWLSLPEFSLNRKESETKASIIIPVRNEEANIGNLLSDLWKQKFAAEFFEVIVVDDFSEDQTATIVSSFKNKNLRLLQLKHFVQQNENISSYKRKAIEVGITNATGELIITTDGDCRMSDEWLSSIVQYYERKKCCMIVAPVLIIENRNFFSQFQSLDFIGMMGITGATLQVNFPTMCNGANLAFSKNAFEEVNGYDGISGTTSGDDLLLMHKMAKLGKSSVQFLKSKKAAVRTGPCTSLRAFISQRMRWTSKSKAYDDWRIKVNLLLVLLFNFSVLISAVLPFFNYRFLMLFVFQFVTKLIVDFAFLSLVSAFYSRRKLMWLFLPVEILHIFYIVLVGFAGNFLTIKWKGRTVK